MKLAAKAAVPIVKVELPVTVKAKCPAYNIEMTPAQWAAVADCDRQRNTLAHAKKALPYLLHWMDPHGSVVACDFNGSLVKLDGHTRAYLWSAGKIPVPPRLNVRVYTADSEEELRSLYTIFDNRKAAETPADQLSGAISQHKLKLKSKYTAAGRFCTALTVVKGASKDDVYATVGNWKKEIYAIDRLNVNIRRMSQPAVAMAMMLHRKYGEACMPFFVKLNNGDGVKEGRFLDCVEALTIALAKNPAGNFKANKFQCQLILGVYQKWHINKDYRYIGWKAIKPVSVEDFFA